jgi:tRNA(Ile)-lysidine synthase
MTLLQDVRQFVREHGLFGPDTRVVAALSGGSDSVALAVLLRDLGQAGDVRFAGVAHFNHQLREQADRDERFSAAVAESLDAPFIADRADVRARARRERRSIEAAARAARYEFLERARTHFHADLVALGHTRDDQAETFLLRLLRGAGPRGLAAMYPRRGMMVRPLLECRRSQLRVYLDRRGIAYFEDETNRDVTIARNRVREELLPLLASRFNPAIVDVLAREADLARDIWEWIETAAERFEESADTKASHVPLVRELDVARLREAPLPLRRLVLWRAMNGVAGGRPISFGHVRAVLRLLDSAGGRADVPGVRVERNAARLVFRGRPAEAFGRGVSRRPAVERFEYQLPVPGEVRLSEAGCVVAAEVGTTGREIGRSARSGRGPVAAVRGDVCQGPLAVRNRRPGDSFRPVGMGGRKKLQDYFVDRKVASARRDQVPMVVDGSNRIVWVAGYGIDEAFRVTDPSQTVLLLRLRQV